MLPASLGDSYKCYKNDTSTFIRWLVETAQSCGDSFKESTTNPSPGAAKAGGRLKGKARKLSKQATSTGSTSNNKPPADKQKTHIVNSSELLELAHAISNSKKTLITMPPEIVRAGMRAVSARKKCTAYFESITKQDDSDDENVRGNESHIYFTKLMEDVLMILQPLFGSSTTPNTNEQNSGSLLQDLSNRFAQLEVEELEEIDDEATMEAPISKQLAVYELKASDQVAVAEEQIFSYYCLFCDLEKLRLHLKAVWADYKAERTDIITAAVITNTAFRLAMRAQDEALSASPGAGNYAQFMSMIIPACEDDEFGMDEEMRDWMLLSAFQVLNAFCLFLEPRGVLFMRRGSFGVYNPLDDRSQMPWTEKIREDHVLLLELLPEFSFLFAEKVEHFVSDEFSKAISQVVLTKEIPIWLTFATTVFLDIHHVMREKAERAFDDFQAVASNAERVMKNHIDFMRNFPYPKNWPAQNDVNERKFIWDIENIMLQDRSLPRKKQLYKESGLSISVEGERFYLYKRQPILCGLLAFRITLFLQNLGMVYCKVFGTAIFPAHLYNALQQMPNPVGSWPDMDKLIYLHTPERVFVGGKPTTIENCFKQACLVFGCSAIGFATNPRRELRHSLKSKNRRRLKGTTPICESFRKGLVEGDSMVSTVHNIEELLNSQAREEALKQNPKAKILRHGHSRLTSTQLLEALQTSLTFELPRLRFDYLHLHRQSIEMLRKLNTEVKNDLEQNFDASYLKSETQLPVVVLWILRGRMNEMAAEDIGLRGTTNGFLEKAGKVFNDFLDGMQIVAGQNSNNSIG